MSHRSIKRTAVQAAAAVSGQAPTNDGTVMPALAAPLTSEGLDVRLKKIEDAPAPTNGSDGATGRAGAKGATGDTGPQGASGEAGPKGDPGATGAAGATGGIGPTGAAGLPGAKGDTGAVGPQGVAGPQGATGSPGPIGAAGAQGPAGLTGATGAVGATGAAGTTGAQGVAGSTGAAGLQGAAGATGAQGAAGPAGTDLTNPKIRRQRVGTPQMLVGANPVVSVVWDTAYADSNYTVQATLESTNSGLLGLAPTITAKSPTGCTVTLKVLIALGIGAGTVHFFAIHD